MTINWNGKQVELTEEEYAAIMDAIEQEKAEEMRRPLTDAEVLKAIAKAMVNTVDIADNVSLRMMGHYPTFEEITGQTIEKQGFKFTYGGKLWKTAQANLTIQAHYLPDTGTESLYTRIDEEHLGNKHDPIPYEGNMALENGKYYVQSGVVYLCNRDTGTAVHHALAELVGLYVQEV